MSANIHLTCFAGFTTVSTFIQLWRFSSLHHGQYEPCHEIMILFVLRKLILQTRMRCHPVGLDVWFLVGPLSAFLLHVCEQRDCADAQARRSLRWPPKWSVSLSRELDNMHPFWCGKVSLLFYVRLSVPGLWSHVKSYSVQVAFLLTSWEDFPIWSCFFFCFFFFSHRKSR